ncbi:MAG: MFS transporter [Deltaproteobacteria bacterium]|nr:MFS transporter [Deltaproteobacteria bacterium]
MDNLKQSDAAAPAALIHGGSADTTAARRTAGTFVAVVVAHIMVDFMGMSVWPVYKTLAGLDVAKAGWIATVIAMSGTALQPLFGSIADRFGPRRVILAGALLTSLAMLLGPLADYQALLNRWLPTLFGFSGFYLAVFVILAAGRLGQDMFHPAGAGLAGGFSARRGAMFLAIFIAVGSIGFGASQIVFRTAYNHLGHHTEILLIPMAVLWGFVWIKCRPEEALSARRVSVIASLRSLRPVARQILALFLILAISSGVLSGLFFLMPEFAHEKGYPAWIGQGGAFGLIVLGSTLFMVPMGHLADRIGRRRTLIAMTILSVVSYHALIRLTLPVPVFVGLCILGGAFLGTVNPLGVAFGQRIAPRENVSIVSAILMGWAWCAGGTVPSIAGELYKYLGHNATKTLMIIGGANIVMVAMAFGLPKIKVDGD